MAIPFILRRGKWAKARQISMRKEAARHKEAIKMRRVGARAWRERDQ
jgi:hypothetical protein